MFSLKVCVVQALVGLVGGLVAVFLIVRFFKLRRLHQLSQTVPSRYRHIPFVGVGYIFIGSCEAIQRRFLNLMTWCPTISKFWLGDYLLYVVNSAEYLESVLQETKKPRQYEFVEHLTGKGLITIPVDVWKRHRKMISPAFNQKNINDSIRITNEQCEILIKLLSELSSKKNVDIGKYLLNCTADIVTGSIFDLQTECQARRTLCSHKIHYLLETTFNRMMTFWQYPDFMFNLLNKHAKPTKLIMENYDQLVALIVNKKGVDVIDDFDFDDDAKKNKFFDILIRNYKNKQISLEEIIGEVKGISVGGFDTSATTLSFILILLAMHPEIQEKLHSEIFDILGPDRPVCLEDINKLQYTENIIKETLRLYPTIPIIARELQQDVHCGKIVLPQGAIVMISIYSVHRDEKYWKDPLKFDPDRFLPENCTNRFPSSYLPFSVGPRNCIGYKLAMMELKVLLPTLIRKFRITCDKSFQRVEDIEIVLNIVLNPKEPIKVNLEMR